MMNDNKYGLTASVWTKSQEHALAIGNKLETGTVFMCVPACGMILRACMSSCCRSWC